jgi:RNA polymerase sigma-70 factor, ECF subfamily
LRDHPHLERHAAPDHIKRLLVLPRKRQALRRTHPRNGRDKIATVAEPTNPPESADAAAEAVYRELRRLAAAYMRRERPGQTLQATALVNEAYVRLADAGIAWKDRNHFIGVAARSMKQILVDRARARGAQKRWGGMNRVSLTEALVKANDQDAMLPALDEALSRLERIDPEQARIVELRYFVGLTNEEIADSLKMSVATVKRRWALARAWLFRELSGEAP